LADRERLRAWQAHADGSWEGVEHEAFDAVLDTVEFALFEQVVNQGLRLRLEGFLPLADDKGRKQAGHDGTDLCVVGWIGLQQPARNAEVPWLAGVLDVEA